MDAEHNSHSTKEREIASVQPQYQRFPFLPISSHYTNLSPDLINSDQGENLKVPEDELRLHETPTCRKGGHDYPLQIAKEENIVQHEVFIERDESSGGSGAGDKSSISPVYSVAWE